MTSLPACVARYCDLLREKGNDDMCKLIESLYPGNCDSHEEKRLRERDEDWKERCRHDGAIFVHTNGDRQCLGCGKDLGKGEKDGRERKCNCEAT